MAVEFFIPKLGQTVEEVTIIDWLVKDGDAVEQGQPIVEVETDKAVFPVEANASGVVHLGPYGKGDVVPVVTTVAVIGKPGDQFPSDAASQPQEAVLAAVSEQPLVGSVSIGEAGNAPQDGGSSGRVFASPRARLLASEKGVDLALVEPSGGMGVRVIEKDVLDYLAHAPKATPLAKRVATEAGMSLESLTGSGMGGRITRQDVERAVQQAAMLRTPAVPLVDLEVLERVPLSGVRGVIAERMAHSAHTTARVTLVMEVDATELAAMRERLKAKVEERWGFAPGYNDLLAKILATALARFPYMNARLAEDAIEYLKPINLGMAVDTDHGLLVPVIRDADRKSLRQFGLEFRQLVERARSRKSLPEDLTGGTFTLTSLGAFGVDAFTPVINYSEAAILGVGRIAEKAVALGGKLAVRTMCTLSLVFDHRLVDGAPAARFLAYIKELVEEPYLLVAEGQEMEKG
jgi:pyruvate dehydrogenase E2 component (dihydrolipoamide acetyltransferase)